ALAFFSILFGTSVYQWATYQSSCGCLGAVAVRPEYAAAFDFAALVALTALEPRGDMAVAIPSHPGRFLAVTLVMWAVCIPAAVIGGRGSRGMVPPLRRDARLARRVVISLSDPTVKELLSPVREATGVRLVIDPDIATERALEGTVDMNRLRAW